MIDRKEISCKVVEIIDDRFLKDIAKQIGNEYASLVADGVEAGDVDSFIDSGSYIFNALLSGSIHGGLPSNKLLQSLVKVQLVKHFL